MNVGRLCALGACAAFVAVTPAPPVRAAAWSAAQVARLGPAIGSILQTQALRGALIGFFAIDTARGTVLYARNADSEFVPASTFKLLVGSAALDELGPNFSAITTLLSDEPATGSTLDGNLYLRGGGDAHLSDGDLDAAVTAVANLGVTHVTGSIVTDTSHDDAQRWAPGWSWDDLPYAYAPVVSALELNEGAVRVVVSPGTTVGSIAIARETPQSGAFSLDNRITTGAADSKDTTDVVRPWKAPRTIELVGSYPFGAKPEELDSSVPDPPSYAGDALLRAFNARGIRIDGGIASGKTPPGSVVFWSHASVTMPKLLTEFWCPSDNLMGELFLKELGVARSGEPGTIAGGRSVEERYLRAIGVDAASVSIADGSGLSEYDRITPRDLVAILEADWHGPYRRIIVNALPLAGIRGTLAHSFVGTPAQGRVYAKTGSLNHVRTLSGFVQTRTHGPVTFSLLVNNWMGEREPNGSIALAKVQGAILSALARQ